MDINTIKNIAAYRAWLDTDEKKNFLAPFVDLTRYYIYSDNRNSYKLEDLYNGVKSRYGIEINVMPMKKIVGQMIAMDVICPVKNDTYRLKNKIGIEGDFEKFEYEKNRIITCYDDVTKSCLKYINDNFDEKTTYDELLIEFNRFIREMVTRVNCGITNVKSVNNGEFRNWDYQIGRFIDEKCRNNDFEKIIKKLMVGELLASSIGIVQTYKTGQFSKTKIILDTPIILRVLGISTDGMQEVYKDIVDKAILLGADVRVFEHTIMEVKNILHGAKEWLDNPEYDVSLASDALIYYKNEGKKEEDISWDEMMLEKNLEKLKINVISVDMNEKYNESIKDIKKKISEVYNNIDGYKEKEESLVNDAESINNIFLMRKRCTAQNIFSCKAVFVTNNLSLAVAAGRYYKDVYHRSDFPHVITDVYLGTLLWMNDTIKLEEMSWKLLTAQTYAALQPSSEFWGSYTRKVEELRSQGELTDDIAFMLRTNSIVNNDLMRMTDGEIKKLTVETPTKLYKRIREQAKKEGVKEATEIGEQKLSEAEERHSNEKKILQQQHLRSIRKNRERTLLRKRNKDLTIMAIRSINFFIVLAMIVFSCVMVNSLYNDLLLGNAISYGNVILLVGEIIYAVCLYFRIQNKKVNMMARRVMNVICAIMKVDKLIKLHKYIIQWVIRRLLYKKMICQHINNELQ